VASVSARPHATYDERACLKGGVVDGGHADLVAHDRQGAAAATRHTQHTAAAAGDDDDDDGTSADRPQAQRDRQNMQCAVVCDQRSSVFVLCACVSAEKKRSTQMRISHLTIHIGTLVH
jgi:hypothetical protein